MIDEVKTSDADENALPGDVPPSSSTIQPGLPPEKSMVVDSSKMAHNNIMFQVLDCPEIRTFFQLFTHV